MSSFAEELLQTRSIPELRELVYSLDKDADSKETELQHMVGSKYHDFIQSADKISVMREKSVKVENLLREFFQYNQVLIDRTTKLLKLTADDENQPFDLSADHFFNGGSWNLSIANALIILCLYRYAYAVLFLFS